MSVDIGHDEIEMLKTWQKLCFKMISAVREFYLPGMTEEILMPKYIRELGRKSQKWIMAKRLLEELRDNPNIELGEIGLAKIDEVLSEEYLTRDTDGIYE